NKFIIRTGTARITGRRTWSCGNASSPPGFALPTTTAPVAAAGKPVVSEIVQHLLGVVVVAGDRLGAPHRLADPLAQACLDPVHHLLTVQQGEVLCPPQVADVGLELVCAFHQVGEVWVGQADPPLLALCDGGPDVLDGQPVTDSARPGVQEQPHPVPPVEGYL